MDIQNSKGILNQILYKVGVPIIFMIFVTDIVYTDDIG